MNFIDFPEANFTFQKPADMTDDQCGSLRVWRGQHPEGYPCSISKWRPTLEERQAIAEGADVFLMIVGHGHPPVSLFAANPFIQEQPAESASLEEPSDSADAPSQGESSQSNS